ncbi:MAG TPA: NAD(P)/FAD-dependent oxidoreductase, partial [Gammaproteobacteria bacterium]|nr:NAD(P)/FAD-dependent oxidoreductase [Gammaproteobacteria bacterium]
IAGREVIVLEKNHAIGEETSSRNSEVIHAGLYYAANSLKARLCVEGRQRLYDYCNAKGIAHRRCGKVVLAIHDEQTPKLEALRKSALANGVQDLEWLSAEGVHELEPAVRAAAGLWSPATGIIDSHALMLALRGDLEHAGGSVAVRSRLTAGMRERGLLRLVCDVDGSAIELKTRTLINAAGLHASRVAHALRGLSAQAIPRTRYAKGSYFVYSGKGPFAHLVYPLPEDGGLGIHATLDLAGRTRFGPDVEWLTGDVDAIDYGVDPARAAAFYRAVRAYWPDLPDEGLEPAYAGVRPRISGPGEAPADFAIQSSDEPGGPRLVQLFGIESPGLTASLAIAEHVRTLLAASAG